MTGAMGAGKSTIIQKLAGRAIVCVPEHAREYRYNTRVFWFEGWRDICAKDDERKMEYEAAAAFGHRVRAIYEALDYEIVPVPQESIAYFIASALNV